VGQGESLFSGDEEVGWRRVENGGFPMKQVVKENGEQLTNRKASLIHESMTGIFLTSSYSTSRKVPSEFPNILFCSS
jgi:hypothetical protein